MVFRKEKEYVIEIHPKHWWRLVCTKVFKKRYKMGFIENGEHIYFEK